MRDEDFNFYVKVLELEIEALRSVISESDIKAQCECYGQFQKANVLADLRNFLVRPRR